MYTTCDEWICYRCGQCKYFKANADMPNEISTCKRLDHKHLRFAKKTFNCYDCGTDSPFTCSDFAPKENIPYLFNHWQEIKSATMPIPEYSLVPLNIDGDTSVRYMVKESDFYNNTFIDEDGSVKWLYKYYYKQSRRSSTGYVIVYETSDGIVTTSYAFAKCWSLGEIPISKETALKLCKSHKITNIPFKLAVCDITEELAIEMLK